jgi:hypothetical protein
MRNIKNKILTALSLLFVISVGIILFVTLREKPVTQNQLVVPPDIPQYVEYTGPIGVEFSIDKFNFPNNLPLIKIGVLSPTSEGDAATYGEGLGFSKNYVSFDDSEFGKTFIWNEDGRSLIIYSRTGSITYSPNSINQSFSGELTQESVVEEAKTFITENKIADEDSLGISTLYGLSSDDEHSNIVSFNQAQVYKVVFSPKIAGFEIVDLNPHNSLIAVWLDKEGKVIKTEVTKLGDLAKTDEVYPTKTYEEFTSSLNTASIISIDDGNILPQDIGSTDIADVTISDVSIAYLNIPSQDGYLKPIFVIQGGVNIKNNNYSAVLYLPALR